MKVFEGLDAISTPFSRSSVAIGTFDGVHRGHQAIIRQAVEDAREHERPALVFTFDRHPLELLHPESAPALITTPEQRDRLIAELDVDGLVVARFDRTLAAFTPEEFMTRILKGLLGAEAIIEGTNFSFGKGRAGDLNYLRQAQPRFGFVLHALEPVLVDGRSASSSLVRELLSDGAVRQAEEVLGHPYWLYGKVVEGQRLGRKLGYPTANVVPVYRQVVPGDGIYAVSVSLEDGRAFGGASSIGDRPTIEGAGRSIETYLFGFDEDIYGRSMEIRFIQRLRLEEKFDSLQALTAQMARDVEVAKSILKEDSNRINRIGQD